MDFLNRFGALFVKKWIAGVSVDDAIYTSKIINEEGEEVMINYLGEHFEQIGQVDDAVNTYMHLLEGMKKNMIRGSIALKATQLGMGIDQGICYDNYAAIIKRAGAQGVFVWLDMEEAKYVSRTISLYLKALKKSGNLDIGICLQAKLRRSYADAKRIVRMHGKIRLVKGAYIESEKVMYTKQEEVFENYLAIMKHLFERSEDFIIASHDEKIVESAIRLSRIYQKRFSFAMLKGIRTNLAKKIISRGNKVFIYVPFGPDWVAYCARRLKEGTNVALVIRSIFQQ